MTKATIKVEFNEQAKAIVANTKIEIETDITTEEDMRVLRQDVLKLGKELFDEAFMYSKNKSINEKN